MFRIPGKVLGGLALVALLVHAWLVVPAFHAEAFGHTELGWLVFLPSLATLLLGRIVLAWLPPGAVGGHAPSELPVTLATSLLLGTLVHEWLARLLPGPTGAAEVLLALLLLAARLVTLPAAMVPRHRVRAQPWSVLDGLAALATLLWAGYLLCTTTASEGLLWLALAVLVHAALGTARRARGGRWIALGALAVLGFPTALLQGYAHWSPGTSAELAPLAALGLALPSLVAWLRRHDRRAGVLAGIGFGAVLLNSWDPLAAAGAGTLLAFSRARQRGLATGALLASALPCALVGAFARTLPPRGEPLDLTGLDWIGPWFGLLLPGALLGLALGALTFGWREGATSGASEPPRREALAVLTWLALALLLVLPEASPWPPEQSLVLLLPAAVLATGLLLVPSETLD